MLKFRSATKFLFFWQIPKISITVYTPIMTAVFIITFGLDQMKTVGGVAFCKFQPHMALY